MKLIRIAFLLLLPFLGSAQTEKGNWLLGGTATFSSIKYDGAEKRRTSYFVAPNVGFFLTRNAVVGLELTVRSPFKNHIFIGANPFGRYYWKKSFIQAKYITNTDTNFSSRGYDLSIGRAFFLKSNVAFEPELYYHNIKGYNNHDNFGMRMGFQFYW